MSYKSFISVAAASFSTAALMAVSATGAMAGEETKNYVGPTIGFPNGGTLFGVTSKFGIADNISARPFVQFASLSYTGGSGSLTVYGASATYDFNIPKSGFTPYAGIGIVGATVSVSGAGYSGSGSGSGLYFEGGADYTVSDSIVLNANYRSNIGYLSIGAGYQF
jgi:opacity protein-like surface antigen